MKKQLIEKNCQYCGKIFTTELLPEHRKLKERRFCGTSCSAKWRNKQPSVIQSNSSPEANLKRKLGIQSFWKEGSDQSKTVAQIRSNRMKSLNPMHMDGVKEKALKTRDLNGLLHTWRGTRGGNGSYSKEQLIIFGLLLEIDQKWELEYPVKTGCVPQLDGLGYPTNYKVDIGNPFLKLGIELDGGTHSQNHIQLKDRKKEDKLLQLRWKILRFTNKEVMIDPSLVISQIMIEVKVIVNSMI